MNVTMVKPVGSQSLARIRVCSGRGLKHLIAPVVLMALAGCTGFAISPAYETDVSATVAESQAGTATVERKANLFLKAKTRDENGKFIGLTHAECVELLPHPRIHAIGSSRILIIDPDNPHLEIIVEGRDLHVPGCVEPFIKVNGTFDADFPTDFQVSDSTATGSAFTVILKSDYLKRLKTGDQLTIWVSIDSLMAIGASKRNPRLLTYANRRFTVFTVEDFRSQVQARQVKAHNFQAFPLSKQETEQLFGPLIADNFFAVRLSVRNLTGEDKLITTGMIIASGRVLVEPDDGIRFTIPVELTPSSLEQVYTILADEEVNQPRPTIFRGLEFIGAIATAANLAFGSSTGLTEGIGFATGVIFPATKKLWPDRWPGYQRNIISFAMQDLTKVPKGSVTNQKFLFFSKNKIEGIIGDPNLAFEAEGALGRGLIYEIFGPDQPWQPGQPNAAVLSVAFDSLDIPFENVFSVEAVTQQETLANNQVALRGLRDNLTHIKLTWNVSPESVLLGVLKRADLTSASGKLATAYNNLLSKKMETSPKILSRLIDQIGAFQAVALALTPISLQNDLIDSRIYGLDELGFHEGQIDTIRKAIARGVDTEIYEAQISNMVDAITKAKQAFQFYQIAAGQMNEAASDQPGGSLGAILSQLARADFEPAEDAVSRIVDNFEGRYIDRLRQAQKGLDIVQILPEPAESAPQASAAPTPQSTAEPTPQTTDAPTSNATTSAPVDVEELNTSE